MPEAVIVATARTPIGRAKKGSLVGARPDDLGAFAIRKALEKVPQLDPSEIVDVMTGCGFPEGEQGINVGRRIALLAGLPDSVPGTTVNRFCSSSEMPSFSNVARSSGSTSSRLFSCGFFFGAEK